MPHGIEWRISPSESAIIGRDIYRGQCSLTLWQTEILQEALNELPIGSGVFLKTDGLPCREQIQLMSEAIPGFVECEPVVYWESQSRPTEESSQSLRTPLDVSEISRLVKSTFKDYRNHYSDDPETSNRVNVSAAYADWAINSVNSGVGRFVVLDSNQSAQGFALIDRREAQTEIMLAGTAPDFRRQGAYTRLIRALLDSDMEDVERTITISTQISNIEVQRVWARNGFVPQRLQGTFHFWR
jgi:ribosomal protein S18 acetylase RimI-like enzyme